jgi:hypothetical protein
MLSSNWTAPEVDQVVHTEASGDFPQLRATGREETAQQPIPAKLLDLNLPALGVTAQPLENLSQLRRDRRLSFADKPSGVVDQLDLASQRKAGNHASSRGESNSCVSFLPRIFRPGIQYSKCGVMLAELTPEDEYQGTFSIPATVPAANTSCPLSTPLTAAWDEIPLSMPPPGSRVNGPWLAA